MRIELPHVGESVTEAIIGKWLKQVGDRVEKYDPLVEVITDKVTMEFPSPVSGVLKALLVEEGQTVPMGAPIAEVETEEEAAGAPPSPTETTAAAEPPPADRIGSLVKDAPPVGPTGSAGTVAPAEERPPARGTEAPARGRRRYSPAVLRLAQEHGVDLDQVQGTGMGGRVTLKDVREFIARRQETAAATTAPTAESPAPSAPSAPTVEPMPGDEVVPVSPVRRIIAENMTRSATLIPEAWGLVEVDVTGLVARREALKEEFRRREGVNLTYLPFVVKAVAESLKENPLLNASWAGDRIILRKRVNIGIAVAAPDGLVVPVIHDADTLSVAGLAKAIARLTEKARDGKLALEDVQGGTFTINNTGALGSVVSKPIINWPQAAILTTEAIVKRPVVVNDAIAIRSIMNVCLAFDHRVMDGAEATAFLMAVKRRLEAIGPETGVY